MISQILSPSPLCLLSSDTCLPGDMSSRTAVSNPDAAANEGGTIFPFQPHSKHRQKRITRSSRIQGNCFLTEPEQAYRKHKRQRARAGGPALRISGLVSGTGESGSGTGTGTSVLLYISGITYTVQDDKWQ